MLLTLEHVLRGVAEGTLVHPVDPSLPFARATNDSRLVGRGDLFVVLRGERDGHQFIADAFRRGASGVLAERAVGLEGWLPPEDRPHFAYIVVPETLPALQRLGNYWLRQHEVDVIGVTGSVGKTTTKELVGAVLSQRFPVLKSAKNYNNEIGLPLSLLLLRPDHRRAVLEMGMYAVGEIAALCRIAPPKIGVITNVGPTHLERLGTIDRIVQAKSELVAALPANGVAVLNGDDDRVRQMTNCTSSAVLYYGLGDDCDVRATDLRGLGLQGIEFTVEYCGKRFAASCPAPGKHNVYACLAAVAVGLVEGLTWDEIGRGLAAGGEHGRLIAVAGRNGSLILDDTYNASPVSMKAALDLLAELSGNHIAVLGGMVELGDYSEAGHREVGAYAAKKVDRLIVVGDQGRWIGLQAQASGLKDVTFVATKDEVDLPLGAHDRVLVKASRLMAMEQVVERLRATS